MSKHLVLLRRGKEVYQKTHTIPDYGTKIGNIYFPTNF